jgi:hypothetical protein
MPGPIARRPDGLLDLLLTQQQGENPKELADTVQPTLDLTKFYGAQRLTLDAVVFSVTAVGATATIEVPQGESWLVHQTSFRAPFNAVSQVARIGLGVIFGSQLLDLGQTDTFTAVGATDTFTGQSDVLNIIFPSGTIFEAICHQLDLAAGSALNGRFNVLYTRMES